MILSEQKSIFKKYRYPMIIRPFLIGVLLALAITAPAGDKMQKVPVLPLPSRAIPILSIPAYTPATSI